MFCTIDGWCEAKRAVSFWICFEKHGICYTSARHCVYPEEAV